MGISYEHLFIVRDLAWRPTKAHGEAIHGVLVDWKLVRDQPELFKQTGTRFKKISSKSIRQGDALPDELVMKYSPMVEGEAVERVLGPLEEGSVPEAKPFIWSISVHLGCDLKVINAEDFGPVHTRLVDAKPTYNNGSFEVVAAGWDTPPPRTEVRCCDSWLGTQMQVPNGFAGLMRSGVIFDCDKARPDFARKHPGRGVPSREFVQALESALGTTLVQVGRYV